MHPNILIAPGYNSSDNWHWQTLWEKENPSLIRIEQKCWEAPICKDWVYNINKYITSYEGNVIVVAHSLACIALAHWFAKYNIQIRGALLVAPPDVERLDFHQEVHGFAPIPLNPFTFKTILVASENDYYTSVERSAFIAQQWGSEFVNAGKLGHINSQSNIGNWEVGKEYLDRLLLKQELCI